MFDKIKKFLNSFISAEDKFEKVKREDETRAEGLHLHQHSARGADGESRAENVPGNTPNDFEMNVSIPNQPVRTRIYKNNFCPFRKLILWGWDNQNNPGFLFLYGVHKFSASQYRNNILEENVNYTDYAVFCGGEGHFPSFEAVKILNNYSRTERKMYFKKDVKNQYYWYARSEANSLEQFKNFNKQISFPYFKNLSYEDYAASIYQQNIKFKNFRLAKTPLEVLNLPRELSRYNEPLCTLFCNPSIYMRKKCLKEIIKSSPPKELYQYLLKVGSTELISGLFLELGLQKNDLLLQEARKFIVSDQNWSSESYINGVKRCASIYINTCDESVKDSRINLIRSHLNELDLQILNAGGKQISKDETTDGAAYRKFSLQGYLSPYYYEYDYQLRKSIKKKREKLYQDNTYTDGYTLNINKLKNTIQESESYGLADVIGKIAYYLDAPRLTYYFKGNHITKSLTYFRRYIRRLIDSYAQNELKFIEAMKSLFLSYTSDDCLCKFKNNFQFNYFIKYYLYNRFNWKAPSNWHERYEWMRNDQLLKLEGRYEFMPEIWDRHLDDVIEIASGAKIDVIAKAFTYILKDGRNQERLMKSLSYAQLISLSSASYTPLAGTFINVLIDKLDSEPSFDNNIMILLMQCDNAKIHELALEYLKRTNGQFSADTLAGFMLYKNAASWVDLLDEHIQKSDTQKYLLFLYAVIENTEKFTEYNVIWPDSLKELMERSLEKIKVISAAEKTELLSKCLHKLNSHLTSDLHEFLNQIIFSMRYSELKIILETPGINLYLDNPAPKNQMTVSLLTSIKNSRLPEDRRIIEIIENGIPQLLKVFIETITKLKEQLNFRLTTTLILLESDIEVLNDLAKESFLSQTGTEKKKMHSMIIDSPVQKAYTYGLEMLNAYYENTGQFIPQEFIIQMLEHPAKEVKSYISDKVNQIINNPQGCNPNLFMYYVKTLLFLPNKLSSEKNHVYKSLPSFVKQYKDTRKSIEEILLDIGGSNIILDSERALVTLAKIAVSNEVQLKKVNSEKSKI